VTGAAIDGISPNAGQFYFTPADVFGPNASRRRQCSSQHRQLLEVPAVSPDAIFAELSPGSRVCDDRLEVGSLRSLRPSALDA
jgi:hypothetical protein